MSLWKTRIGDTDRFALELSFDRDPDAGRGVDPDNAASWGSFQVWVGGRNLCTHDAMGERFESVHWYLLPLLDWFVASWDPMLHEQRLPRRECVGGDAWQALQDHAWPPRGMSEDEEDKWLLDWQAWRQRHAMASARSGGLFPDLMIRRWQQQIELSWGPVLPMGAPQGFRFVDGAGHLHLDPSEVAEPLYQALGQAIAWLACQRPESARLVRLQETYGLLRQGRIQERLAWIAGLGADRWAHFVAILKQRFRDAEEAVNSLLETEGDLVLRGSCRAPVMFGSLSPSVGERDLLEIAGWQVAAWEVPRKEREVDRWVRDQPMAAPPWRQGYELAENLLETLDLPQVDSLDIEALLSQLGIKVKEAELGDPTIRGLAFVSPQHQPTILINQTYGANRRLGGRRFTLAHELCHLLYDRDRGQELAQASGPWTSHDVEKRANAFAAMLLMPVKALLQQREHLGVAWDRQSIWQLSQRLQTGFLATLEHLTNLGLLSDESRAAIDADGMVDIS